MDPKILSPSATGTLTGTIEGRRAFVPDPIPPDLDLGRQIAAIERAGRALGELNGIGRTLANPFMVIRPLQRTEALRSSAMEGTYSTADDLALAEALAGAGRDEDAEVLHYIDALDHAVAQMATIPISHRMIRGMHEILLQRAGRDRGGHKRPGAYKIHQNWIGARQIERARFIPPPPEDAARCMDRLEAFLNEPPAYYPPLVSAALAHYQFETIHPFADGNGRVGRMLIPLFLMQAGVLEQPTLYLSPFLDARKNDYIDRMFAVSVDGDWDAWIAFFMEAVEASCRSAVDTIGRLGALQEDYRNRLQSNSRSVSALAAADHLFIRPVLTIREIADVAGISPTAARKTVGTLIDNGIVTEVPREISGRSGRLFWSRAIISISDGE